MINTFLSHNQEEGVHAGRQQSDGSAFVALYYNEMARLFCWLKCLITAFAVLVVCLRTNLEGFHVISERRGVYNKHAL